MSSIDPNILAALSALSGAIVGGLISYFLQKDKNKHELEMLQENNKTEFMAENTAKHYLGHKGYTDRSFEVLKKHLGGFEEDELRKILVRAGAIRIYKDDGTEMWRLLSRSKENAEKKGHIESAP
jgi:hypothetical protein